MWVYPKGVRLSVSRGFFHHKTLSLRIPNVEFEFDVRVRTCVMWSLTTKSKSWISLVAFFNYSLYFKWVCSPHPKSYSLETTHVHSTESPHLNVSSYQYNCMSSFEYSMQQSCCQSCQQATLPHSFSYFLPNGTKNCVREVFFLILQGTLNSL